MACVNADGSLTPMAQKVLEALQPQGTVTEISQRSGIPLYRVRASVRELGALGMLETSDEIFTITDKGLQHLASKLN